MTAVQWYHARGTRQSGPVTAAELKQLAQSGQLKPDDLVWREGMADWAPARTVRGLFEGEIAPPPKGPAPSAAPPGSASGGVQPGPPPSPSGGSAPLGAAPRHLFDVVLDAVRGRIPAEILHGVASVAGLAGHYALYAAMLLVLLFHALHALRGGPFLGLVQAVGTALVLALLQYAAMRSCEAIERLNRTTEANLSSRALPDCLAVLALLGGAALCVAWTAAAVQTGQYPLILYGLAALLVGGYLGLVALHPESIGVSSAPDLRAGEEAIGVLSFLLKSLGRLVPVVFGAGVVCSVLVLVYASVRLFGEEGDFLAPATALVAEGGLVFFAALPLAAYLLFLLYHLSIDAVRAVLLLPGKLDALRDATSLAASPDEQGRGEAPPARTETQ